ncbi:MAG TPA: 5'-nucleotidase C-terminal domain-containing protein [Candidatus Acidoferrales bacterium]|nr:5'-nucleotidase C-terminal domain-containing protein [Candidatus Acidoferrales bacterium]
MKRFRTFAASLFCAALLIAGSGRLRNAGVHAQTAADDVTLTLLSTTDSHGHLLAWDDMTNKPANWGLAKIATLVETIRATAPNVLLLDCGDTIEGTPLAYYFNVKKPALPNPEIAVFNAMHYDAMAVGNHEFNFGERVMWKAKRESHFPWLAANLKETYTSGVPYFQPYIIKRIAGVRVGIVGFVTPGVPRWEIPSHYRGYTFEPIVDAARRVIPEVRAKCDLLVVIMHSGLDRNPKTGEPFSGYTLNGENEAWELAQAMPTIDVIFYGHTHQEMPQLIVNGVLMAQAKNWGQSLARADVKLNRESDGRWKVTSKHSTTIRPAMDAPPDAGIVKIVEPYHSTVEKYLDAPIAAVNDPLNGTLARYEDEPLVDLIHRVQMQYAHADVSLATLFIPSVHVAAGAVTIRDAFGIYPYENTLYGVQMTGAQLKDALEHAASFYPAWPAPADKPMRLPGYDADSAEGVAYEMDLTKPVGSRITNLTFHGAPISVTQKFRVAINNYRYTGGGGYSVFKGLPVAYRSTAEVRDLIIAYLEKTRKLPAADRNWRIVPDAAREAIEKQAMSFDRQREQQRSAPKAKAAGASYQ